MPSLFRTFFRLLRGALVAAYEDGCLGTAKGAAYSAFTAFFPLLATMATILVHFQANFVSRQLSRFLADILPPGTHELVFQYFVVRGKQPFLIPLTGMLVSVWAASGVIVSLAEGFRTAYRIPAGRSFLHERVVALLLVLSAAIPMLIASTLILFGVFTERWLVQALGLLPAGAELHGRLHVLTSLVRVPVALGAITLGAAILYRFGPNRPLRWRQVWPGAVLATVLWLAATTLFAWYARHIANYNLVYGGVAAVILLLVWMYVLAVIALIGCEFNAQCEKQPATRIASGTGPAPA
jgi:membrane protein